jgi:hypothetical protein
VSDYPYVYSYDLDGWRGGTADYSYGWLWAYGNVSTGAWFWDFFTENGSTATPLRGPGPTSTKAAGPTLKTVTTRF